MQAATGLVVVHWAPLGAVLVEPAEVALTLGLLAHFLQSAGTVAVANAEVLGDGALHIAVRAQPPIHAGAFVDILRALAGANECAHPSFECGQGIEFFLGLLTAAICIVNCTGAEAQKCIAVRDELLWCAQEG
jgi:hypothetical protein